MRCWRVCILYFLLIIGTVVWSQEDLILESVDEHFRRGQFHFGHEYYSNNTGVFIHSNDVDDDLPTVADIYENTNFKSLVEDVIGKIARTSVDILYGEAAEDEEKENFVTSNFGSERIASFVNNYMTTQGQTVHLCPDTEVVKRVLYALLINSFRTTLEILFEREMSDLFALRYFRDEGYETIWQDFENSINISSADNICEESSTTDPPEVIILPDPPTEPIDIDKNIVASSKDTCGVDDGSGTGSGGGIDDEEDEYVWGHVKFAFELGYTEDKFTNEYYVGAAFGPETINKVGQYVVYYSDWGYMGYQPYGIDINGRQRLRLFYATINKETYIEDENNCRTDIDSGVHCAIIYRYILPNRVYYLKSEFNNTMGIYTGYFIDSYNKNIIQIGSFKNQKYPEYKSNKKGFIGNMDNFPRKSCCSLKSVNVLVLCPFGMGVTCNKEEINEVEEMCMSKNTDMYSKELVLNIQQGSEQYKTNGYYIHKGWDDM